MRKFLLFILILMIFPLVILRAGTTGKLTGKIVDAKTNEPLVYVNVILLGTYLGAASDKDGNYTILNIPPGRYNIRVQYIGYRTVELKDVPINIDLTTRRNFKLEASTVQLGEIVVEDKSRALKMDITSSQSSVSAKKIESLPVTELNDILQLQSGVSRDANGDFHIRGGRNTEIAYSIGGVSITDAYDNSRGLEIDNSSIQELQVISGTFNAEYGNAMSGIVNIVTKEGSRKFHGGINLYSSDYVSNFTSFFPNIDNFNPVQNVNFQANLSGPIPFTNNKLTFFVTGRYNYDDGYLYGKRKYTINGTPGDGKYVPMNWKRRFMGHSNLTYWPSQYFKFNAEFLYSKDNYQDYDHFFAWNPDGNVKKFARSYNGLFTFNHILSSKIFYTLKASYFLKDFNEHLFANPNDSRYLHPDSLKTVSFAFVRKGTNLHRFFRETNTIIFKGDFTAQLSDHHLVQFGGEADIYRLKFDDYTLVPLRKNGIPVTPFKASIPDASSFNRKKYENRPLQFAVYIQDKIEYKSVIINIGLRFDYFNSRGNVLVDPTDPNIFIPLRPGLDSLSIAQREPFFYKKATAKYQVSPRFGIAYPIGVSSVLHFSYGHFLQIPTFQYLFNNGSYKVPETGDAGLVFGNPDLRAQKTIMYELGFRQEFMDDFLIDMTVFYRDIRDWVSTGPSILTKNLVTYSTYINKDFSNVKGITLNISKRMSNYYGFDINYTYQVAEGSNSNPEDEFRAIRNNEEPARFLTPLNWDQRQLLNATLFVGKDDFGGSILARYGTGLPYTPSITQYTSDRGISAGILRNSKRRPAQFTLDVKLYKTFNLFGLKITSYLQAINVLDNRVVVNVFGDTGSPDFTTANRNVKPDADRLNTIQQWQRFPSHYGPPRKVQFGIDMSF